MNLKRNTVLAGAVAAALGLVSGTALAAGTISVTPQTFVQEITATATSPATLNFANPTGKLGFGVSSGQSVYLRFNLSGDGATFDTASQPALTVGGTTTGTLVSGGSSAGFAIFQVTAPSTGFTQNEGYTLTPYAGKVTGTTGSVTISYAEYANAPDASNQTGALASASTTLLSFAQTLDAVGQAGTPFKIDVGSNNTKFITSASPGVSSLVSPIGEVAIGALTGRLNSTGSSATYAMLVSSGTLTVTGNFAAASSVFLSTNASCAVTTTAATSVSATQAVFNLGTNIVGTFNGTGASSYENLCYQVSSTNTTPIAFGVTYTATYVPTATPNYTLPGSFAMTLGTLTTNGVTAQALNIPNATNTDQPYIRIYNTSTLAGPIRGTLYAQDGTVLYNGVLIPSLAAHAVKILTAQDLETLAGASWTGRAYLTVFGQIPGMDVQLLIRDANGTLVNVSSKAPIQ